MEWKVSHVVAASAMAVTALPLPSPSPPLPPQPLPQLQPPPVPPSLSLLSLPGCRMGGQRPQMSWRCAFPLLSPPQRPAFLSDVPFVLPVSSFPFCSA